MKLQAVLSDIPSVSMLQANRRKISGMLQCFAALKISEFKACFLCLADT
jgi:hypothetical protein